MGTVLQQSISGTYTAVAQVLSISRSGCGDEVFDATSLDSPSDSNSVVWKEKVKAGATEPGKVAFEVYFDPALTGHQAILGQIGVAPSGGTPSTTAWKVIYPNSGGAFDGFTSAGIQYGIDVKMGDGLKASFDLDLTGAVTQVGGVG
jgi:hypothetical protein